MRTFVYGCLQPTTGLDTLFEQLRLASNYRNRLVELELWRRAALFVGEKLGEDLRDEVKREHALATRAARSSSGLGWGTYQLVEQDVERASRTRSPRFRRGDGQGRVGAAVQACSRVRTEALEAGASFRLSAAEGFATAELRVARDQWIVLPVKLHRRLPAGQVVRAWVQAEGGGRWEPARATETRLERRRYRLMVVVKEDAPKPRREGAAGVSCAVNFGWRRVEGGVRVAYAVGSDGTESELVIPSSVLDGMRHSEKIRSIADGEAARYLGDARRRGRARRAAILENPPHGGSRRAPWENAGEWALQDRHLKRWERHEYEKAVRRRRAVALAWVQRIACTYDRIRVEAFSLAGLAREAPEILESAHVRFMAAPGELRDMLRREVGKERLTVVRGKMTAVCNACGGECEWDRAREVTHVCEWCGAEWDQDANNARNQHRAAAAE